MQDQKMEDQIAGPENAGLVNVGPDDRGGKCRTKHLNSADAVVA